MLPGKELDIEARRGRILASVFLVLVAFAMLAAAFSFLGPEYAEPLQELPWTVRTGVLALVVGFVGLAWERERQLSRLSEALLGETRAHYMETLKVLACALDAKDQTTQEHTGRLGNLVEALAKKMRLPDDAVAAIRAGAILHDIGKIGIPDAILTKPGPLTAEEWTIMKTHPVVGEEMLKHIDFLVPVLPLVRHHHENWDGTGYPDGLAGSQIPIGARIIAVCDAFDAMTSDRPYGPSLALDVACQRMLDAAGTQFDPDCARMLIEVISEERAAAEASDKITVTPVTTGRRELRPSISR
jgi:putative nucleotidyltransferase with HDIG domain